MKELKEKTFTEGRENALEERDREDIYNPNKELPDSSWMRYTDPK
jgi:hypothetical protein